MVIYGGSNDAALAFDDGPNPKITSGILDVLAEKGVKATFFIIGKRAEEFPEIVRRIANEGHEIGNHSYTHKRLAELFQATGREAVLDEIQKSAEVLAKIAGADQLINFFRPPYLDWDQAVAEIARPIYGDRIIMASAKSGDYSWGKDRIWDADDLENIENQSKRIISEWAESPPGTIIGLHDGAEYNLPGNDRCDCWENRALPTLKALPSLIDLFLKNGLSFKKLSDMNLNTE